MESLPFLCKGFFAFRIWRFSNGNLFVTVPLVMLVMAEFVSVVVYFSKAITMETFVEVNSLKALSMTVNALAVAGDVLITVASCILLHRSRSRLRRSNTMINLLIIFSVQTGMLTSFCAIACLVSIAVWPNTFIYICFYFLLGRLYCNSLLATLNIRKVIREIGHSDLGISLRTLGDSSTNDRKGLDTKVGSVGYIVSGEAHRYSKDVKLHRPTEDIEAHGCVKEVEVHVHEDSSPVHVYEDSSPFVRPADDERI